MSRIRGITVGTPVLAMNSPFVDTSRGSAPISHLSAARSDAARIQFCGLLGRLNRRWGILFSVLISAWCCNLELAHGEVGPDSRDSEPPTASQLVDRWTRLHNAVETAQADVHFLHMAWAGSTESAPSREQLRALVLDEVLPIVAAADGFVSEVDTVTTFFQESSDWDPAFVSRWVMLRVIHDAQSVRNDRAQNIQAGSMTTCVRRSDSEVDYDAVNGQATLHEQRTSTKLFRLDDLRYIPSRWRIDNDGPAQVIDADGAERRTEDRVNIQFASGTTVEADTESGFVHHASIHKTSSGRFYRERWQFLPQTVEADFEVPRLSVDATYRSDSSGHPKLSTCSIFIVNVEGMKLNRPLAGDIFSVGIPAGTTVVDYRNQTAAGDPRVAKAHKPFHDVLTFPAPVQLVSKGGADGGSSRSTTLLLINLAAIAIIAGGFGLRRFLYRKGERQ